mmetsp:Transcript_13814/g.41625  ORF Transcript_13814/g.41625 Transcript_13814/m.41625 type:complete len:901 (-) Transcript_13814:391-3093(-)
MLVGVGVQLADQMVGEHLERLDQQCGDSAADPHCEHPGPAASVKVRGAVVRIAVETERSDDGGDGLRHHERHHDQQGGTLSLPDPAGCTRREDHQLSGDGHEEVDHAAQLVVVERGQGEPVEEDGGLARQGEQRHRAAGEVASEHAGDGVQLEQAPVVGQRRCGDVVAADGEDGAVVEHGQDHDQNGGKVPPKNAGEQTKGEHDAHAGHQRVHAVGLHALKDLAGAADGVDDHRETRRDQDDVGGAACSVGGVGHSDTHAGRLERRRVIHTVTGHAHHVEEVVEARDHGVLVLGEDLGKAVGARDHLVGVVGVLAAGLLDQVAHAVQHRILASGVQSQLFAGLDGDGQLVAGDHLHQHAQLLGVIDGGTCVHARRIKQRQHAEHAPLERAGLHALRVDRRLTVGALHELGAAHAHGTESARCQVQHGLVVGFAHLVPVVGHVEHHLRRALGHAEGLAVGPAHRRDGTLAHRIEGHKLEHLVAALHGLQLLFAERADHGRIDRVAVGGRHGEPAVEEQVGGVALPVEHDRVLDRELVERERAGLVGAEHVEAGQLLDHGEARHDGLLARQPGGAHGQRHREHGGHGDRHAAHDDHQRVGERGAVSLADAGAGCAARAKLHAHLDGEHGQDDGDAEPAHAREHLLKVTLLLLALHQQCSLAKEGVHAGGVHHGVHLAVRHQRAAEHHVAQRAVHRHRLSGQRALIHQQAAALHQLAVGRHHVAQLEMHHIAGHQLGRVQHAKGAVAAHARLGAQLRLERRHRVAGVARLPVADAGVEDEQRRNQSRVNVVAEDHGQQCGHLHGEGERVRKVAQELEHWVFALLHQLVAAVLLEQLAGARLAQALGTAAQTFERLVKAERSKLVARSFVLLVVRVAIGTINTLLVLIVVNHLELDDHRVRIVG